MRLTALHVWAVIVWLCAGTFAAAQSLPEYDDVYINDFAGLLRTSDSRAIRGMLEEVFEARGIEMVVVTMETMRTYGHSGEIEPFATRLFNHWGVGNADRNDGVMILVARDDRQMRIEVGSGYGDTQNAAMQRIIDDTMLPAFRRDDYSGGVADGTQEVIRAITGVWPGSFDGNIVSRTWNTIRHTLGGWIWGAYAGIAGFAGMAIKRFLRRRRRKCPNDGTRMTRMAEGQDDARLDDGQIVEERIRSIDYDVWYCDQCEHVTIEGYRAWFSRYGACNACGYRTLESDTVTLRHATTRKGGLKRRTYTCRNCSHSHSEEWTTARKSQSSGSSSSSGSRSSFGGGSSSGGGASGRW